MFEATSMTRILQPDRNCWRIERANRFSLLVDAANYYGTLVKTMKGARRWIALLGWDLDTRTELFGHDRSQSTGPLREFLRDLVTRNPELDIFVLAWSFPMLFANVRDPRLVRGEDPR